MKTKELGPLRGRGGRRGGGTSLAPPLDPRLITIYVIHFTALFSWNYFAFYAKLTTPWLS